MNNRQIETSREVRLWIGQVIVPVASVAALTIMNIPGGPAAVVKKVKKIKNSIKEKFHKREA